MRSNINPSNAFGHLEDRVILAGNDELRAGGTQCMRLYPAAGSGSTATRPSSVRHWLRHRLPAEAHMLKHAMLSMWSSRHPARPAESLACGLIG